MITQTEDPPEVSRSSPNRQELFEKFFHQHHEQAIRFGIRRGLSDCDAREVAADAMRIVWQKCELLDDSAIPFLYKTCWHLVQHAYRDRLRRFDAEVRARRQHEFSSTRERADEDMQALRDAVMSLGEPGSEIIRLLYWDGLTAAQVAAVTNHTEQAVWAQASRSRRKLAKILKGTRRGN
ncbi:sigma-70 family RNA polymerase sigma factor [Glutamicibacter ectropisis]|uniref:Sigma-70 family RNA polymerase sigma factor n=1 Tax=Glutamicibacter ectropisis TaxID=3046593 RepID=A0AAU6WHX2_9MICC